MIQNNHNDILKEFGDKLGLNLTFDENRSCEIFFEDKFFITIHSEDEDGIIIISTIIKDKFPDDVNYNTVLNILDDAASAYLQGGNVPAIGFDEESGSTILYQACTASYLAQNKFIDIFTAFIEYLENISKNL